MLNLHSLVAPVLALNHDDIAVALNRNVDLMSKARDTLPFALGADEDVLTREAFSARKH